MNTTVQKFKALLKARKNSDCEKILAKCSSDEIQKIACALKTHMGNEFAIVIALDKRRFERDLLLNREKFLKGLRF